MKIAKFCEITVSNTGPSVQVLTEVQSTVRFPHLDDAKHNLRLLLRLLLLVTLCEQKYLHSD